MSVRTSDPCRVTFIPITAWSATTPVTRAPFVRSSSRAIPNPLGCGKPVGSRSCSAVYRRPAAAEWPLRLVVANLWMWGGARSTPSRAAIQRRTLEDSEAATPRPRNPATPVIGPDRGVSLSSDLPRVGPAGNPLAVSGARELRTGLADHCRGSIGGPPLNQPDRPTGVTSPAAAGTAGAGVRAPVEWCNWPRRTVISPVTCRRHLTRRPSGPSVRRWSPGRRA